jgi:hypothetical protein
VNQGTMPDECAETLRRLDRYMDEELDAAGNAAVRGHMEGCPACRGELELRRRLRIRLKNAVDNSGSAPYLGTRVLASVRASNQKRGWNAWGRQLAGAAAAAVVLAVALTTVAYERGHLRLTPGMRESYIAAISNRIPSILRVGLGDHVHCSVFRKFPKNPPGPAETSEALGPEYRPLFEVVRAHAPDGFQIVMAHQCSYHGRRFVHLTLKGDTGLISLVITRKQAGESFKDSELRSAFEAGGLPVFSGRVQRFGISGFETGGHLAYLVSDLPDQSHSDLMLALAPGVHSFLAGLES